MQSDFDLVEVRNMVQKRLDGSSSKCCWEFKYHKNREMLEFSGEPETGDQLENAVRIRIYRIYINF
jgi:hypothetical protein